MPNIHAVTSQVSFVDEHGNQEAGIDQGGLLKELLEQVLHVGFDPKFGLVQCTADGKVYPSPLVGRVSNGHNLLEFLGLVVGKALYEGMLLDLDMAPLFVMALQRRHPALDDLYTLDLELYESLIKV
jgi:ubiquitin-protein ligase E3 C